MAASNNNKRRASKTKTRSKRRRDGLAYVPTAAHRKTVRSMAGYGISHDEIGLTLDPTCTAKTLRKHFAAELASGRAEFKRDIGDMLVVHLKGRPAEFVGKKKVRDEVKPSFTVAQFLAKTVLGYRETNRTELTGADGMPLFDPSKLAGLDDRDIELLERLLAKAVASEASAGDSQGGARSTRH